MVVGSSDGGTAATTCGGGVFGRRRGGRVVLLLLVVLDVLLLLWLLLLGELREPRLLLLLLSLLLILLLVLLLLLLLLACRLRIPRRPPTIIPPPHLILLRPLKRLRHSRLPRLQRLLTGTTSVHVVVRVSNLVSSLITSAEETAHCGTGIAATVVVGAAAIVGHRLRRKLREGEGRLEQKRLWCVGVVRDIG